LADEGVLLRIGSEVGEDVPHMLYASIDLDLGVQFFHRRYDLRYDLL
jgi:hypothetical protein